MTPDLDRRHRAAKNDPQDKTARLIVRLRCGEVSAARVEAAARCGHPAALNLFPRASGPGDEISGLELLTDREARLFACDCAEATLAHFEDRYPDDRRPREAIDAARRYARGEIDDAARSAARSAAWSAAWSAARSAAWSAAESAAREKQRYRLALYLLGEAP